MKLADPGITTEPRGITASQSRPADIFTTAAVPGRSAVLDVCVPAPLLQQLAETPHRREQSGFSLVSLVEPLHHWGHISPLDGGPGDHDHADSETDTAIPDDDDIVSLASYAHDSV